MSETSSVFPEEESYWSLFQSAEKLRNPEFVTNLSDQKESLGEEGRVAIITLTDGDASSIDLFNSSGTLRTRLRSPPAPNTVAGQLIILEGLPKEFIKVLGAHLKIPPAFFSAHWYGASDFTGVLLNRTPRNYDHEKQFHLSFTKLHWVSIEQRSEDKSEPIYLMKSSIQRSISRYSIFGDEDGPWTSNERVSFWGGHDQASKEAWNALIIVDPPLGNRVRWRNSPYLRKVQFSPHERFLECPPELCQKGSWYPSYQTQTTLDSNSKEILKFESTPEMKSLFDDMVLLYDEKRRSTWKPYSCTDICRRLVLSAWTAHLRIIEAQIAWERIKMNFGQQKSKGGRSAGDKTDAESLVGLMDSSWARPWHARDFGRLARGSMKLRTIESELRQNMDALGVQGSPGDTSQGSWEADAWRSLQEATQLFIYRVDGTLESYMQSVSVRQSVSAGQLTVMATLFLPVSLVAAIFSMGGDFAAGQASFWVFWVSAAIFTSFGLLLLFTRVGARAFRMISPEGSLV